MIVLRIGAGLLLICIGVPLCWFSAKAAALAVGSDRVGSVMGSLGGAMMVMAGVGLLFDMPWVSGFLPGHCEYC